MEKKVLISGTVLLVLAGIISGWLAAGFWQRKQVGEQGINKPPEVGERVEAGKIYGSPSDVFKDTAVGILEKNGFEGEGTHKLLREGGESQTVYLTSSVLDLDLFVGRRVQVWGQTYAAQKVGWLMDVGRVKVLE